MRLDTWMLIISSDEKMTAQEEDVQLLTTHRATKALGVTSHTLRRWERQNLIQCSRSLTPSQSRLYHVPSRLLLPTLSGDKEQEGKGKRKKKEVKVTNKSIASTTTSQISTSEEGADSQSSKSQRINYLYTRVSSPKQKEDLQRQIKDLQIQYPDHEVLSDIGSGINWNRKALRTLLERACQNLVGDIVVSHRDRLCRFAFELLDYFFSLHGATIRVVHASPDHSDAADTEELAADLMAINTVFICRNQGRRAAAAQKKRKALKQLAISDEEVEEAQIHYST